VIVASCPFAQSTIGHVGFDPSCNRRIILALFGQNQFDYFDVAFPLAKGDKIVQFLMGYKIE
jgi:hypothetical protein